MTEEEFRQQVKEKGYGEPAVKEYGPFMDEPMHTHDFAAALLILSGEFTLVLEDGSTTYRPGEWCELSAGVLHTENTGAEGAKFIFAKK